jgi:hypothetical protein
MWNAWTAPPGALPRDYDPWSCEAHCARCGELAQDCHCEDDEDMGERDFMEQTSLGRALRRIASTTRLSSLDVPIIEEAADRLDAKRWQPIDSAPMKDKRVVMLYGEEFGRRVWMRGYYFKGVPGDGEGWITNIIYCEPNDDWRGSGPQPTHWTPLPSAPGEEHTS